MSQPLQCAHCGETKSMEGFVQPSFDIIIGTILVKQGSPIRIECARAAGYDVPVQERYEFTVRF